MQDFVYFAVSNDVFVMFCLLLLKYALHKCKGNEYRNFVIVVGGRLQGSKDFFKQTYSQ